MARQRALFVCTKNSARSQMAEGLVRYFANDRFDVASAGIERTSVHPLAIRVMAEIGVDCPSPPLSQRARHGWGCWLACGS
jgi:arsenate reductase